TSTLLFHLLPLDHHFLSPLYLPNTLRTPPPPNPFRFFSWDWTPQNRSKKLCYNPPLLNFFFC
uniref:Uncharacterized protein n=2 Tax=Ixodes scapularis TaxID=6945 RepID=A0A1S4KVH1_IXOSC